MRGSPSLLARDSLRRWLRTPGFLIVVAVALVPAGLTAAWTWTHDADIAVTALAWDREVVSNGEMVNITATIANVRDTVVGQFNVTLRVGYYEADARGALRWRDTANETLRVGPLAAGGTTDATFEWNATAGTFQVEAWADVLTDEIPEIEDLNNYRPAQIAVRYPTVRPDVPTPPRPEAENGTTPPKVNVSLGRLSWTPADLFEGDNATFNFTVTNGGPDTATNVTVELQVFSLSILGQITAMEANFSRTLDLPGGESSPLEFTWRDVGRGRFVVGAFALPPTDVDDADTSDDVIIQQLEVERRLVWKEPEPQATAKDFYRDQILLPLQFGLLVPLIGIYYAGNVLHDDRTRGNLPYILSRPVPRWWLPLVRFGVGFGVVLVPVLLGVLATYTLLLGTPRADPGYLYWPLLVATLVTFLYSAVFTLVGVVSRRPYLVGLAYVLGFETLLLAGRRILVNGQPLIQDRVLNLSLSYWVETIFGGWDRTDAWLPSGEETLRAILVVLGIGVVSLAAAAWIMTHRETPE